MPGRRFTLRWQMNPCHHRNSSTRVIAPPMSARDSAARTGRGGTRRTDWEINANKKHGKPPERCKQCNRSTKLKHFAVPSAIIWVGGGITHQDGRNYLPPPHFVRPSSPGQGVQLAEVPVQLRHVDKVHAVERCDEGWPAGVGSGLWDNWIPLRRLGVWSSPATQF